MRISSTLLNAGGQFARPTKYNMILTLPGPLQNYVGQNLDVLCKSVQAPNITNETLEIKIKGQPIKLPTKTIQTQEINVTFYVDELFTVRKLFQDWIAGLDIRYPSPRNGRTADLVTSGEIYGSIELIGRDFNETTGKPISFFYEEVFPTTVGELDFSTADKDTVQELTVTFAYTRAITNTIDSRETIENLDDGINAL